MDWDLLFWALLALLLVVSAVLILIKKRTYITAAVILIPLLLLPRLWVILDCREKGSSSEACVWGSSLEPLYMVFFGIVGCGIFVIWTGLFHLIQRFRANIVLEKNEK